MSSHDSQPHEEQEIKFKLEKFTTEFGIGYRFFGESLTGEKRAALGFFGNRQSTRERLEKEFPNLNLVAVRQTHSHILIHSPCEGEMPEADAHWTQASNVSVGIRTADCVPVLILDLESSLAVAIHAGWRGVENEIIVKSLRDLKLRGLLTQNAIALIGPHISQPSFEVGADVAAQLKAAFQRCSPKEDFPGITFEKKGTEGKTHIDLDLIVRAQLLANGISDARQTWLGIDTVTSREHESFRRDREQSGRQISFAAILK